MPSKASECTSVAAKLRLLPGIGTIFSVPCRIRRCFRDPHRTPRPHSPPIACVVHTVVIKNGAPPQPPAAALPEHSIPEGLRLPHQAAPGSVEGAGRGCRGHRPGLLLLPGARAREREARTLPLRRRSRWRTRHRILPARQGSIACHACHMVLCPPILHAELAYRHAGHVPTPRAWRTASRRMTRASSRKCL